MGFWNWLNRRTQSADSPPTLSQHTPSRSAETPSVTRVKRDGGGQIHYFHLEDWWDNELSGADRLLIRTVYRPMGTDSVEILTRGHIGSSNGQTTAGFLATLASWMKPKEADQAELAVRILDKAWTLRRRKSPGRGTAGTFAQHVALGLMSKTYYRYRDDPRCYERALACAKQQIDMQDEALAAFHAEQTKSSSRNPGGSPGSKSTPSHEGFKRMAIELERQKDFKAALELVHHAKTSGWAGDWDKRIERLQSKL